MIYLVTSQKNLFDSIDYQIISKEEALTKIYTWNQVQFDTETSGRDPHICKLLCAQFGNKETNTQIVVDTTTIDFNYFKDIFNKKLIIGHNLKFDCQFLYKYNIIPNKVWDTMIVEQLLHLGYSSKNIKYSLQAVAERRLNKYIDKSVRGEIIWRGLDSTVVKYAAGDVVDLEDIMSLQIKDCKEKQCIIGAKLENAFVPVIAYLEWCGIILDVNKWNSLIKKNQQLKIDSEKKLNEWLVKYFEEHPWKEKIKNPFLEIEHSFFEEFNGSAHILINWSSSTQLIPLLKLLGFNVSTVDKKTGKEKESAVEKLIKKQKGINDEFISIYYDKYQAATKLCSTYGQQYIDAINPITNRIHTTFRQLGASSGRMSCGNMKDCNTDLAKYKNLPPSNCRYVQLQNLPADEDIRSSFIPSENNLMVSCDYSALESRLGADIYNETNMIKEFTEGSGDIHSLMAATFFDDVIPPNTPTEVIKHKYKEWRKKAKSPEFKSID